MAPTPGPVKIGHKKDGRQRRPHRFHVSRPPPYPAAGSATVFRGKLLFASDGNSLVAGHIYFCDAQHSRIFYQFRFSYVMLKCTASFTGQEN